VVGWEDLACQQQGSVGTLVMKEGPNILVLLHIDADMCTEQQRLLTSLQGLLITTSNP
jgi:hypothetical protein